MKQFEFYQKELPAPGRKPSLLLTPMRICRREVLRRLFNRKVDYYMETPGPLSICIVNMVIVFAVLTVLAFIIQLIHVVDPTKNSVAKKK